MKMTIVAKKDCSIGGKQYKSGGIYDVDTAAFDIRKMANHGVVEKITTEDAYTKYCEIQYLQLQGYLDEKMVDYRLIRFAPDGSVQVYPESNYKRYHRKCSLFLHQVPPKLYHEVVVPGIIQLCKRVGITIHVQSYARTSDGCTLYTNLYVAKGYVL